MPLRLAATCELPPMSEVLCWVRAYVPEGELGILEKADTHARGAKVRGALVKANRRSRVPVSLINFDHETLFLPKKYGGCIISLCQCS